MGVVRCERCDSWIDLDYNCEVFTNDQIPGLTKDYGDWVCFECLTDEEAEKLGGIGMYHEFYPNGHSGAECEVCGCPELWHDERGCEGCDHAHEFLGSRDDE